MKTNTDPRCQQPADCKAKGLRCCSACANLGKKRSPETIAKMRAANLGKGWRPPAGFEELYIDLKRKLGAAEAKRLVVADAELKAKRMENAA